MSVRSIYKRLQDSPTMSESESLAELDPREMSHLVKIAMSDRDARVLAFLATSSKIDAVFAQAIAARDDRLVHCLLSHGVSIGPWRPSSRTAIHQAIYSGHLAIVDELLSRCDNSANLTDPNGLSHFHAACACGNLEIARGFLNLGTDPKLGFRYELSADDSTTLTALHLAVKYTRCEIVELLLDRGADPNASDDTLGLTPLHLACFRQPEDDERQLEIMRRLLERGSDVNARDRFGNTPLLSVFQDNRLTSTTRSNCADIAVDTLGYRGDFDDRAARKNKVELLLKYRADAGIFNDEGDNALHLLIETMESLRRPKALAKVSFDDGVHVEIASSLLRAGASVGRKNHKRQSPLQLAACMLSLDMVELLLRHEANVGRIRFDEDGFCYSEDVIPSLEATENLLGIVERLSSCGLITDKQSNLAVLKFLIGNHINCRYDVWTDRNASYKLKNLLELGTDENIITAFSKFPLDMYDTTFKGQYLKKQMVQQIYEHVTILEKGGLYVSNRVHKSLNSKITSLEKCILEVLGPNKKLTDVDFREFESEFQAMKATALSSSTSLHDMLTMSPRKIYYYIKNYGYKKTCSRSEEGKINYSRSYGIMKGHFAKSLVRKYASKSATEYFRSLIDLPLPDLCCEKIFDYLDNDNLLNLCAASAGVDRARTSKKFKSADSLVFGG